MKKRLLFSVMLFWSYNPLSYWFPVIPKFTCVEMTWDENGQSHGVAMPDAACAGLPK